MFSVASETPVSSVPVSGSRLRSFDFGVLVTASVHSVVYFTSVCVPSICCSAAEAAEVTIDAYVATVGIARVVFVLWRGLHHAYGQLHHSHSTWPVGRRRIATPYAQLQLNATGTCRVSVIETCLIPFATEYPYAFDHISVCISCTFPKMGKRSTERVIGHFGR